MICEITFINLVYNKLILATVFIAVLKAFSYLSLSAFCNKFFWVDCLVYNTLSTNSFYSSCCYIGIMKTELEWIFKNSIAQVIILCIKKWSQNEITWLCCHRESVVQLQPGTGLLLFQRSLY